MAVNWVVKLEIPKGLDSTRALARRAEIPSVLDVAMGPTFCGKDIAQTMNKI